MVTEGKGVVDWIHFGYFRRTYIQRDWNTHQAFPSVNEGVHLHRGFAVRRTALKEGVGGSVVTEGKCGMGLIVSIHLNSTRLEFTSSIPLGNEVARTPRILCRPKDGSNEKGGRLGGYRGEMRDGNNCIDSS